MTSIIAQNVGVDISKATLDVHLHPAGAVRRFTNDAQGIEALIGWLGEHDVARIVFEPTGSYHHRFERRLGEAGCRSPRSTRCRRGALPRRWAPMPRPTRSTPRCSPEWARC